MVQARKYVSTSFGCQYAEAGAGTEGRVQRPLQKRFAHYGLCRMRQVQALGRSASHWSGHSAEAIIRHNRRVRLARSLCRIHLSDFCYSFADLDLKPSEIVAFFNTLHRMSQSLAAIEKFRDLWSNRDSALNLDDNTNRNELPAVEAFSSPVESSSSTASEASIPSSSISETSSTKAAKQTIHFANPMLNGGRRPKIIYDQRPPPGFDEIPQRPEPHRLELPKQNKAANIFTSGRARRLGEGPKGNPAAGDWIVKVLNKAQIVWDKHVASRIGSLSAGKSEL